jgi:hypothetical protein
MTCCGVSALSVLGTYQRAQSGCGGAATVFARNIGILPIFALLLTQAAAALVREAFADSPEASPYQLRRLGVTPSRCVLTRSDRPATGYGEPEAGASHQR